MSEYTDYILWESRTRVHAGFGMTAGDSHHLGLHNYTEAYPLPNGLPIDHRGPGETEWWRKRVEKAKRDIERIESQHRVADLAATVTEDIRDLFLLTLRG